MAGNGKYGTVLLRSSCIASHQLSCNLLTEFRGTYIAAFTIIIRRRRRSGLGAGVCGLVVDSGQSMGLVSKGAVPAQI